MNRYRGEDGYWIKQLTDVGWSPREASAIVRERRNTGWTPEEREAIRRFCAAANHVIGVHWGCDHGTVRQRDRQTAL